MPQVNYNLKETYEISYKSYGGYSRLQRTAMIRNTPIKLKELFNIQPNESILIIGAGFGWIPEEWLSMGLGPVYALDTSEYIQNNLVGNANIPIYNIDIIQNTSDVLALNNNQPFRWAFTDNMITVLTDTEVLTLASNLRSVAQTVVHYTQDIIVNHELTDPLNHNWKTLASWKSILYPDIIVEYESHTIA